MIELNNVSLITFHHARHKANNLVNIIANEGVISQSLLHDIDLKLDTPFDLWTDYFTIVAKDMVSLDVGVSRRDVARGGITY